MHTMHPAFRPVRLALLLWACLLSRPTSAQLDKGSQCLLDFHVHTDSLYEAKAWAEGIRLYECSQTQRRFDLHPNDRYWAACFYAKAGKCAQALEVMRTLVGTYHYRDVWALQDTDFVECRKMPDWQALETRIRTAHDSVAQLATRWQPLSDSLQTIGQTDQGVRQVFADPAVFPALSKAQQDSVYTVIGYQDSLNLLAVTTVLDRYGWVNAALISDEASSALFLVIQHAPKAVIEKYLPLLRAAVRKGAADARDLAWMEDRLSMYRYKPQRYGSQMVQLKKDKSGYKQGITYVYEVEDPAYLDCRRATINVPPMVAYLKMVYNQDGAPFMPAVVYKAVQ